MNSVKFAAPKPGGDAGNRMDSVIALTSAITVEDSDSDVEICSFYTALSGPGNADSPNISSAKGPRQALKQEVELSSQLQVRPAAVQPIVAGERPGGAGIVVLDADTGAPQKPAPVLTAPKGLCSATLPPKPSEGSRGVVKRKVEEEPAQEAAHKPAQKPAQEPMSFLKRQRQSDCTAAAQDLSGGSVKVERPRRSGRIAALPETAGVCVRVEQVRQPGSSAAAAGTAGVSYKFEPQRQSCGNPAAEEDSGVAVMVEVERLKAAKACQQEKSAASAAAGEAPVPEDTVAPGGRPKKTACKNTAGRTGRIAAAQETAGVSVKVEQQRQSGGSAAAQASGAAVKVEVERPEASAADGEAAAPGDVPVGGRPNKTARKNTGGATGRPRAQKAPAEGAPSGKVEKKEKAKAAGYAAGGVIGTVLPKAELAAALAALKKAVPHQEMKHVPGAEPYRALGIHVNEKPCVSAAELQVVKGCQKKFWEVLQKARRTEAARIAANNGVNPDGTKMSQRPDVKARKIMKDEGHLVNTEKTAGHVPGHPPNNRYFLRSEMGVTGLHFPPLAGIDFCPTKLLPPGCPEFALSIVNSGCYEDDEDDGEELDFTGQGGCNLLGNKKQVADQQMVSGNRALVGNIELGVPIRVIRKNKDASSEYSNIFIYDGLYDVTKYWTEKGKEGFDIFKYHMIRRPGQTELLSKTLAFGGASAPKNHSIESRGKQVKVVSKDISNGLERIPVPAVNDVDDELPFPSAAGPSAGAKRIRSKDHGVSLPLLRYVVDYVFDEKMSQPAPRVLPPSFRNKPHEYLKELNSGQLPYCQNKNDQWVIDCPRAMVFECGPWSGCRDGVDCGYALTQQGLQWRLEVFKTRFKGWGVRSWDTIPVGSYVATFFGRVYRIEDTNPTQDDTFYFDLGKRIDYTWDNQRIEHGFDTEQDNKYFVDGGEIGGVSRYINHSCDPNLYVQPVLSAHADTDMPKICLFAAKNIPPFEELTYDYGEQYIRENLDGKCNCGAACCQFPAD